MLASFCVSYAYTAKWTGLQAEIKFGFLSHAVHLKLDQRHVSSLHHSAFHLCDKTLKANNCKKKSLFWLMVLEATGLGCLVLLCGTYGRQLSTSWRQGHMDEEASMPQDRWEENREREKGSTSRYPLEGLPTVS